MVVVHKRQRKYTRRQSAEGNVPPIEETLPGSGPGLRSLSLYLKMADEPITSARKRLNENRRFRRVAQRIAQPLNGGIQAMIEVYEGVRRPELAAELLPGDEMSPIFKQCGQYLEGLFLELYLLSSLPQFPGLEVDLERTETDD